MHQMWYGYTMTTTKNTKTTTRRSRKAAAPAPLKTYDVTVKNGDTGEVYGTGAALGTFL